jgi:hypothetical protein
MKHEIKLGDKLIATIETHDGAVVTIVEPQGKVTDAHSSLVLDELQNPDYSHLIGKWVMSIESKWGFRKGKWYKMFDSLVGELGALDENGEVHCFYRPKEWFNLTDPRDTNPDEPKEVRIPFSIERYDSGDFIRYETRDGRVPENVYVRKYRSNMWPVVVTLPDQLCVLSIGGYYTRAECKSVLDLLMVIKDGDK